ncbi:MAG TPA: hypothetical protein VFU73_01035 [Actinocrinis sp.]|nr:hypothetical protein [Actinocrinis sp.]
MTDFRGGEAVDEYRRALLGAARDRVVADAEQEVCLAWAAELAHVGHMTRLGVATAKAACDAARTLVRARQAAGDPQALSEAQRRLEMAEEQARQSVGAADALLEIIGEEQELMTRAAQERALVAKANRVRIWSAWEQVRDVGGIESPSPELDALDALDPMPAPGALGGKGKKGSGAPNAAGEAASAQSQGAQSQGGQGQTQAHTQAPAAPKSSSPPSGPGGRKRFWRGTGKGVPGTGTGPEPAPRNWWISGPDV